MTTAKQAAQQQPEQQAQQYPQQQASEAPALPPGLYPIPVMTSERIDLLLSDLIDLLNEPEDIAKDATNPAFSRNGGGGKYPTLEATLGVVRPLCALHRFGLLQCSVTPSAPNLVAVQSVLLHKSGQWVGMLLELPVTKADAQGVGGGLTYARRYSALALTGRAPMDDDAETTKGKQGETTKTGTQATGQGSRPTQAATQAATSTVTQAAQAAAADVIAPDQVAIVRDLIKEAKMDAAKVLQFAGATRVEEINPTMYAKVVKKLQATIAAAKTAAQ